MRLTPGVIVAALLLGPPVWLDPGSALGEPEAIHYPGLASHADSMGLRRTPVVRAIERVKPATVNITTTQQVHRRVNPFFRGNPFFQEFFGYSLTPDTRQQKIALIVGPKRSGKGTLARVLVALVDRQNTVAPTLASLSQNFGLRLKVRRPAQRGETRPGMAGSAKPHPPQRAY